MVVDLATMTMKSKSMRVFCSMVLKLSLQRRIERGSDGVEVDVDDDDDQGDKDDDNGLV